MQKLFNVIIELLIGSLIFKFVIGNLFLILYIIDFDTTNKSKECFGSIWVLFSLSRRLLYVDEMFIIEVSAGNV